MTTWTRQKFKDFIRLQRGFDLPNDQRIEGVYPVVASTSINGFHNEFKVNAPCVITGRSGALGEVLFINKKCWPLNTTLWVKDFYGNDPKFVYYKLKTLQLESFNSGAGVPTLNRNHLDQMQISIPDLPTQQVLAAALSLYDMLIENNEKRIKILEEMAQRLYIEWFEKFKFPGHEKVKMVNSPLGKIPEGWEYGVLRDIADVICGFAFKSSDFTKFGIPVIKIKNIISNNTVDSKNTDFVSAQIMSGKLEKYLLNEGDIIIAMTGATAGKVGRIETKKTMLLNQRVAKVKSKKGFYSLIWGRLSTKQAQVELYKLAGGAAQPNMSSTQIERIKVIIPSNNLLRKYEELAMTQLNKIIKLQQINQSLIGIRDLLIPQLVTGKREVKQQYLI